MILEKSILAVITTNKTKVQGGGAPVFLCEHQNEMDLIAKNLEAILDGIAHSISEDMYIIVKHFE